MNETLKKKLSQNKCTNYNINMMTTHWKLFINISIGQFQVICTEKCALVTNILKVCI